MSRTLSAFLQQQVAGHTMAEVPYVTIRVVTDHSVPTFAPDVLLSTYPFSGSTPLPTESGLPFLNRITFPVETMSHLPSPRTGGTDTLTRQIRFTLVNSDYEGSDLYSFLTAGGRLDHAELALDTLVVPPSEMVGPWTYIHGETSQGETVPWFIGRIDRVVSVGSEIQCIGKTVEPQLDWKLVPDDGSDPRDRGTRLPYPLGENAVVRCVNLIVGGISSLTQQLPIGSTQVVVDLGFLFPSDGATVMVGAEAVTYTVRTGNVLGGVVTRAAIGTVEADHIIGTPVIEAADITLAVAGYPVSSVTGLFILNEATGVTIEVPNLSYTVQYDNEIDLPGSSGDPITTVKLTSEQVAGLLTSIFADAAVTQQAEYQDSTAADVLTDSEVNFVNSNTLVPQGGGTPGIWVNEQSAPAFTRVNNGVLFEALRTQNYAIENTLQGQLLKLSSLVSAHFDVVIDVTTLTGTNITIGLVISGVEGVLQGVTDGQLVATHEFTSTGQITITGTTYLSAPGALVGDLSEPLVLDVYKSEVAGGNPSVEFDVISSTMEFTYREDAVEAEEFDDGNESGVGVVVAGSVPWQGNVASLQQIKNNAQAQETREVTFSSSNFTIPDDSTIVEATFTFRTDSTNIGVTGDIKCYLDFPESDWPRSGPSVGPIIPGPNPVAVQTHTVDGVITQDIVFQTLFGTELSEFFGRRIYMYNEEGGTGGSDNGDTIFWSNLTGFTMSYIASGDTPIPRIVDSQIQASAGGVSLQFFAVCDGPLAPSADYDAGLDGLMNHPSDLCQYWLREIGGFTAGDLNLGADTVDGSFANAVLQLPGYEWGFDARNIGSSWWQILNRMGYESRANLCRPSGGVWNMFTAKDVTYAFPTPTLLVDSIDNVQAIGKDDSEIRTRLTVYSGFDPRLSDASSQAFLAVQTTDTTDPLVIAREDAFGINVQDPVFLFCHTLPPQADPAPPPAAGVTDWRLYQEFELGRYARVISCRVDHWQGYALELGDMVDVSHDTLGPTPVKCRVIETQRDQRSGLRLRFVEVT